MTEDKMVGWHHQLNGHEFEQTLGDVEGQGSLACCNPWGHKEQDVTEPLKNKCLEYCLMCKKYYMFCFYCNDHHSHYCQAVVKILIYVKYFQCAQNPFI